MSVFIPPVAPATPDSWGAPVKQRQSSNDIDKDAFLKLMVAQLKYQDPLSPADPQQFLAQTAQFTSVEKLEHIATQVSEQTWAMALNTASGLVGQEITFLRMDGTTGVGVVGSATTDPEGIVLNVGGEEVPLGAITRISPAPSAQPSASATPVAKPPASPASAGGATDTTNQTTTESPTEEQS